MEAIIVALIGLAGSAIGSIIGVMASAKLTSYRLEQLEKKVEAHNQVIDRVYKLEERTEIQEEKISFANQRIEDLEKKQDSHSGRCDGSCVSAGPVGAVKRK